MDTVKVVEDYIKAKSEEYKKTSKDHYDFWNEHIKYVYEESQCLAKEYNADLEIVLLGALLHDISLVCNVGDKKEHHIIGRDLANKILEKNNYPTDKKERVLKCVYNHRSTKNATSLEELCVADADILAHFDNIPMLFNIAFNKEKIELNEIKDWLASCFEKDYNDLSARTKEKFKDKYKMIQDILLKN